MRREVLHLQIEILKPFLGNGRREGEGESEGPVIGVTFGRDRQ